MAAGLVAQLVGSVAVPEREHLRRDEIADACRCRYVARAVRGIECQLRHQRVEDGRLAAGEQVHRRAVGGIADGFDLVLVAALARRATQGAAEPRADSLPVVGGPGVVHARMCNRERASHHRWAQLRFADALEQRLVPADDDVRSRSGARPSGGGSDAGREQREPARAGRLQEPAPREALLDHA